MIYPSAESSLVHKLSLRSEEQPRHENEQIKKTKQKSTHMLDAFASFL